MREWEASHTGLTIDIEELFIPAIIGKSGETIRAIQKDTKCKIDVDRIHSTLTVREGTESARLEAMNRVKAIIEEETILAAERAAEKEKLRQEQAELARANAKAHDASAQSGPTGSKPEYMAAEDLSGIKDRSGEFSARPVGWTASSKPKNNDPNMDAMEVSLYDLILREPCITIFHHTFVINFHRLARKREESYTKCSSLEMKIKMTKQSGTRLL